MHLNTFALIFCQPNFTLAMGHLIAKVTAICARLGIQGSMFVLLVGAVTVEHHIKTVAEFACKAEATTIFFVLRWPELNGYGHRKIGIRLEILLVIVTLNQVIFQGQGRGGPGSLSEPLRYYLLHI